MAASTNLNVILPIVVDQDYPALKEALLITLPNLYLPTRISKRFLDTVYARVGEPYLLVADPASNAVTNLAKKVGIVIDDKDNGDLFVEYFCSIYTENEVAKDNWEKQGYEVASNYRELVLWY